MIMKSTNYNFDEQSQSIFEINVEYIHFLYMNNNQGDNNILCSIYYKDWFLPKNSIHESRKSTF
jgi:hypothetical protein